MRRAFLIFLCVWAGRAAAEPLGLRTQGPLRELFLDMTLSDARSLRRTVLDVRWSMANSWNEPMALRSGSDVALETLDEQADSLSASVRFPWPRYPFISTGVELRGTVHWGGWSDRPIEAWHSLTGAFNYDRAIFPRNDVRLLLADERGTAFDVHGATVGFGDVTVRNQATLVERSDFALAARLDFKLPTGSLTRVSGSGAFDAGIGALASWQISQVFALYGMVSVSRFSEWARPLLLQPKPWHLGAEASLEATLGKLKLYVEDRVLSPLLMPGWSRVPEGGNDGYLSSGLYASFSTHNQISFGARYRAFSLWLSEDFTPGSNPHAVVHWLWVSNAPDVVLGLAYSLEL